MGSVLPFNVQDKRGMNKGLKKISAPPVVPLRMAGWDDCLMGVAIRAGQPSLFVYDSGKVVTKLMETGNLTEAQAFAHFKEKIASKWLGPGTPLLFMKLAPEDKLDEEPEGADAKV